jgi:CarD family transcriptional regulator
MDMFDTGDAVMHPELGAGVVVGLSTIPLQDEVKEFYKINILSNTKTTIMVPIDGAEKLGLRHAISEVELDEVWNVLAKSAEELPDDNKKRYMILEAKLEKQDISNVAEIVRDLAWRRKQKKRLNRPAQRIYDKAMRLLTGEIAVSQSIQMQSAQAHIKKVLDANLSRIEE